MSISEFAIQVDFLSHYPRLSTPYHACHNQVRKGEAQATSVLTQFDPAMASNFVKGHVSNNEYQICKASIFLFARRSTPLCRSWQLVAGRQRNVRFRCKHPSTCSPPAKNPVEGKTASWKPRATSNKPHRIFPSSRPLHRGTFFAAALIRMLLAIS